MLLGFGHKARQGKNTAAMAVLSATPLETQVRIYAYGDALKMEARKIFAKMGSQYAAIDSFKAAGLAPDWVIDEEPKPRSFLQWYGCWKRSQQPSYWIDKLDKTIKEQSPELALISDVRFQNEAEHVKALGGYLVKVVRTGTPDVTVHDHESETALDGYDGWDFVIEAATLDECRRQAVEIYKELSARERHYAEVLY